MDKRKLVELGLFSAATVAVLGAIYWYHTRYVAPLPQAGPTLADFGISDPQALGGALATPYGEQVAGSQGTTNPGGTQDGGGTATIPGGDLAHHFGDGGGVAQQRATGQVHTA